ITRTTRGSSINFHALKPSPHIPKSIYGSRKTKHFFSGMNTFSKRPSHIGVCRNTMSHHWINNVCRFNMLGTERLPTSYRKAIVYPDTLISMFSKQKDTRKHIYLFYVKMMVLFLPAIIYCHTSLPIH